jgi:3-oxocholest-4-en-26-oyl-CoA dehydrogenase alpha subunit
VQRCQSDWLTLRAARDYDLAIALRNPDTPLETHSDRPTSPLEPVDTVAANADTFAADLARRLEDEEEETFQGMPSDGDSRVGYEAMGAAGWIGLHWPERLGGGGLTPLHTLAAEERFGYHWLPLSGYLLSVKTIGNALLRFASPELQERLIPPITAGRLVFCQGFSEPGAGSDLAALTTRGERRGETFVVAGHKIWTSSAELADWIYLAVRTDPNAVRPQDGISVLVADMRTPGLEVRPFSTLGGGQLCEVFLDDVEIPATQLVGELHGGWRVLMATLDYERVTSEKVGILVRVLDDLEPLVQSPIDHLTLLRLRGEAEAARLHGRRATRLLEAGQPASAAASMAKLSSAVLAQRIADEGVRMLGPAGLVEHGPGDRVRGRLAALTRAAVGATISGGSAEIQRRVIARRGLGCPA